MDYKNNIEPAQILQNLRNYLPPRVLCGDRTANEWTELITNASEALGLTKDTLSRQEVKEKLVGNAMRKWVLQFSAIFQIHQIRGPTVNKNNMLIAINSRAVFFVEQECFNDSSNSVS